MTICCLNPNCPNPQNAEGTTVCQSCQTPITILDQRYHPLSLLSDEGGCGRTYLAKDLKKLDAKCVIKQLCPQQQEPEVFTKIKELFEKEAIQLEQLGEHPQIPSLLAFFPEGGYLYLIQQYIQGKTIDKLYNRCWDEKEVRDFLNNILPVFEFIHSKQIIHRDIKPSNIMRRDDNGQYILIDFGASKNFAAKVTPQGTRIGTKGYVAYEQMQSGEAYNASDLFSLGATCFFLLTQVDPSQLFVDKGYEWVKEWQSYLKQYLSDQLKQVLDKLLQKDRRNRYQSATEVLNALQSKPIGRTFVPTSPPRRKFLQYLGYGGIGVVSVGLLSLLRNRNISLPFLKETVGGFPLETFSFETVKVDPEGNIIQRETKQGKQFSVDLGNDVFLDMVQIPGRTFMMGSPETEEGRGDNEAQQQVTVDDFYIGTYQVTQEQWQAIMGNNPSYFDRGGKYPVETVSWDDCQEFCEKLSEKTGLTITLPTEAQWEYACRAGTTTPFYYGETLSTDIANYYGRDVYGQGKKGVYREEATKVGSFPANGFGLYDMHGNVFEWCQDNDQKNDSQYKTIRGGFWGRNPSNCRSAYRIIDYLGEERDFHLGFRIVCVFGRTL